MLHILYFLLKKEVNFLNDWNFEFCDVGLTVHGISFTWAQATLTSGIFSHKCVIWMIKNSLFGVFAQPMEKIESSQSVDRVKGCDVIFNGSESIFHPQY